MFTAGTKTVNGKSPSGHFSSWLTIITPAPTISWAARTGGSPSSSHAAADVVRPALRGGVRAVPIPPAGGSPPLDGGGGPAAGTDLPGPPGPGEACGTDCRRRVRHRHPVVFRLCRAVSCPGGGAGGDGARFRAGADGLPRGGHRRRPVRGEAGRSAGKDRLLWGPGPSVPETGEQGPHPGEVLQRRRPLR